mgnify:CR=1 FL=1
MIEILIIIGSILLVIGLICLFTDSDGLAFFFGVIGAYFLSGGIMMHQDDQIGRASCRERV